MSVIIRSRESLREIYKLRHSFFKIEIGIEEKLLIDKRIEIDSI